MSSIRRADLDYLSGLKVDLDSAVEQCNTLVTHMTNALAPAGDGVSSQSWAGPDAVSFIALWEGTFKKNLNEMAAAFSTTSSNVNVHRSNYVDQTAAKF